MKSALGGMRYARSDTIEYADIMLSTPASLASQPRMNQIIMNTHQVIFCCACVVVGVGNVVVGDLNTVKGRGSLVIGHGCTAEGGGVHIKTTTPWFGGVYAIAERCPFALMSKTSMPVDTVGGGAANATLPRARTPTIPRCDTLATSLLRANTSALDYREWMHAIIEYQLAERVPPRVLYTPKPIRSWML